MTKGEALQLLVASPENMLGDNLLEIAAAYWLEKGYSPDQIVDLLQLALDGSSGEDDDDNDAG